jgi:hypothetical protein
MPRWHAGRQKVGCGGGHADSLHSADGQMNPSQISSISSIIFAHAAADRGEMHRVNSDQERDTLAYLTRRANSNRKLTARLKHRYSVRLALPVGPRKLCQEIGLCAFKLLNGRFSASPLCRFV